MDGSVGSSERILYHSSGVSMATTQEKKGGKGREGTEDRDGAKIAVWEGWEAVVAQALYASSGPPPSGRITSASQPAPAKIKYCSKLTDLVRDVNRPLRRSKIAQA